MSRIKPNLFIVGTVKAGTTSLYTYLDNHPDVCMCPVKEPNFFSDDIDINKFESEYKKSIDYDSKNLKKDNGIHLTFIRDEENYINLFDDCPEKKVIGEASTSYLYSRNAAENIYRFNSNSKIIIILRNPIIRAFSHWLMDLQRGSFDSRDFIEALKTDYNKNDKGWGVSNLYVELGKYYTQVKRYLDVFPRKNVRIYIFEEIVQNYEKFLEDVFDFLDIEKNITLKKKRYNKAKVPKNRFIAKLMKLSDIQTIKNLIPGFIKKTVKHIIFTEDNLPKLSKKDYKKVKGYFENDIEKLSGLIDKNLSLWMDYSNVDGKYKKEGE